MNASSATGREFARKALHLSFSLIPVAYSLGAPRRMLEAFLLAMSATAVATEGLRRMSPAFGTGINRAFGPLMREHEKRSITGATWLTLSCLVAVTVLSRGAAIAALWCATVGDPAATIAGRLSLAGRGDALQAANAKTLAGSLACALGSFAGVWALAGYPPVAAAAIAIAGTAAEAIPSRVDDNVLVAGAAGTVAQLLA